MHFLQAINSDISVLIVCNKTGGKIKEDKKITLSWLDWTIVLFDFCTLDQILTQPNTGLVLVRHIYIYFHSLLFPCGYDRHCSLKLSQNLMCCLCD